MKRMAVTALLALTPLMLFAELPLTRAQRELSMRLFNRGMYREAVKEFTTLADMINYSEMYFVYFWRGNAYFRLEEYTAALTDYEKAARSSFTPSEYKLKAQFNIIAAYNALALPEECEKATERFLLDYPNASVNDEALFFRANAYFAAERYWEARERFNFFLHAYPHSARVEEANLKLDIIALAGGGTPPSGARNDEAPPSVQSTEEIEQLAEDLKRQIAELTAMKEELEKREQALNEKEALLREIERVLRQKEASLREYENALIGGADAS